MKNLEQQVEEARILQEEFVSIGAMQKEDYIVALYNCKRCNSTISDGLRLRHYKYYHMVKDNDTKESDEQPIL